MGSCSGKIAKKPDREKRKTPLWAIRCFKRVESLGMKLNVVLDRISVHLVEVYNMIQ